MGRIGKKTALLLMVGFLLLLPGFSLFGQSSSANARSAGGSGRLGDNLTLKIAVIGPGDELYFWWGHIGLVVEDNSSGQGRFYDWGVFSFDNENFFVNFAFGRLLYTCAVSRADLNYNVYVRNNRDITLYTLDLPAERKEAVLRFAENNMRPENRDYAYHHFRDNCATRIRDIIDIALEGRFKAEFGEMPSRFTLRQHVRRHTWFNPFFDWILNFWMGQGIDRPITVWDDMFLPSEIAMRMKDFRYTGPDGKERPLVGSIEILNNSSNRPVVLDAPRLQWPRELAFSLFISALVLLAFFLWHRRKGFRVFAGFFQVFLGLFFGIAGTLLCFMSFFTNHDYTYHNSNVIFVNPLLLAAIPLGIIFAFTKDVKKRFLTLLFSRALWTYVFLGGLITMIIKLTPAFYQQNQVDLALILPPCLTMVFITWRLGRASLG